MTNDPTAARTIRAQIGTDAWLAVSARQPKWWTDGGDVVFAFRFGSRHGLPKWCEITYRKGRDDYDVTAYKIHRNGCKRVLSATDEDGIERADWTGVYADRLGPLVREANTIGELG